MYSPSVGIQQADMTIKLSAETREELGRDLIDQVRRARTEMNSLLKKINALNNLYEGNLRAKTFPWEGCSNVNVPLVQWVCDTYHAHILDVVAGTRPITLIQPAEPADKAIASAVEAALETVHIKMMDIVGALDQIVQYGVTYGTCPAKVAWREEYSTGVKLGSMGEPIPVAVPRRHGPRLEFIDLRNFVIYPLTSACIDEAEIVGDLFRLSKRQIRQRIDSGVFDKTAGEAVLANIGTDDWNPYTTKAVDDDRDTYEGIGPVGAEQAWFWELIAPYDADKDGIEEDCVFTLEAETGLVVRASRFPYWHGQRYYVAVKPFPRPGRFFGRGMAEILEQAQLELNAFLNQWLDANTLAMCKTFKQRRDSDLEPDSVSIAPGKVIPLAQLDDLMELEINPLVPGVQVLEVLRDYAERASGINDVSLGRMTEGDKTAQEVSIVHSEGGIRFGQVVDRVQRSMTEVSKQAIGLMYQFMDNEELANLSGATIEDSSALSPQPSAPGMMIPGMPPPGGTQRPLMRSDLDKDWDYVPHGNIGTANKVQQRQEALALYDKFMGANPNPLVLTKPTHVYRVTEDLLTAFGRRDVAAFIGTEGEAEQREQQAEQMEAMAAQQQQEMMSGAGGPGPRAMAGVGGPMGAGAAGVGGAGGGPAQPSM